ncbi:hypothetical protein KY289_018353 [Solanum tuberosum]|nr:hypothetical protein KY289_018353 [Solanum tuberosum]
MNEVSKGTLAEKVGEETKKTMAEIVMNKMKGQCEGRDDEGGDKVDIDFSSVKNTMVEKMEWETNEKTADVDSNNSIEVADEEHFGTYITIHHHCHPNSGIIEVTG